MRRWSTGPGRQRRRDPVLQEARAAATEQLPEAIGFIRSSANKMERLINAILKLAREGRRPLKAETRRARGYHHRRRRAIQHQLSEADGKIDSISTCRRSRATASRWSRSSAICWTTPSNIARSSGPAHRRAGPPGRRRPDRVEVADNGRGIAERDRNACSNCLSAGNRTSRAKASASLMSRPSCATSAAKLRDVELGRGHDFRLSMPRALSANRGYCRLIRKPITEVDRPRQEPGRRGTTMLPGNTAMRPGSCAGSGRAALGLIAASALDGAGRTARDHDADGFRAVRSRAPACTPPPGLEGAGVRAGQQREFMQGVDRGPGGGRKDRGLRISPCSSPTVTLPGSSSRSERLSRRRPARSWRRRSIRRRSGRACSRSSGPAAMSAPSCRRRRPRCSMRRNI